MANVGNIAIEVKVGVSDETVCRCLRILEMWQDEHPHDQIIMEQEQTTSGIRHRAYIHRNKEENNER